MRRLLPFLTVCLAFLFIQILFLVSASAYKPGVYKKISKHAVNKSQNFRAAMENLGLLNENETAEQAKLKSESLSWWIQHGSDWEDGIALSNYGWLTKRGILFCHFYNPITDLGYKDIFGAVRGQSLIERAHDNEEFLGYLINEWSYEMAKKLYYTALTGDVTDINENVSAMRDDQNHFSSNIPVSTNISHEERERFYAWTLQALGHTLHLIQDASVPAHTRNDLHGLFEPYESWTMKNIAYLENNNIFNEDGSDPWGFWNQYTDIPIPDVFIDTNQLNDNSLSPVIGTNQGIAEYSHANFMSEDTIFTFDLPLKPDGSDIFFFTNYQSDDFNLDVRQDMTFVYLRNKHPGGVDHLALAGVLHPHPISSDLIHDVRWTTNDLQVNEDYAEKLIPRAVGYSAGLLDYFFRGEMEIKKAYVRIGSGLTVSGIDFEVKNITPPLDTGQTVEPFEFGSLDLSYQYIPDGQDEPVFHLVSEIYTIAGADDPINSEDVPVSVTFPTDIPAKAKDLSFTLVFRGKLGNETDAVVGKMLIPYSRIAFCFQPGGPGNEINIYTMLPDGSDVKPITTTSSSNPNDSLYFLRPAWSPDGTMLAFEEQTCTDPDATGDDDGRLEYSSRDIVVIDLNSDESYPNNVLTTLQAVLTDTEGNQYQARLYSPFFSPDGTQIVATAYESMLVFDVNTGAYRFIPISSFNDIGYFILERPAWSAQEDKIVFSIYSKKLYTGEIRDYFYDFDGDYDGFWDICLIRPDGSGVTWLTDEFFWNKHPSWSPDGESIVFVSDRDGEGYSDIWIMDKTGGNMEKILDCNPDCHQPSFSPEGLRIVFMQNMEIFTMNFNGSDTPHATPGDLDEGWPAWSPFLPVPVEP